MNILKSVLICGMIVMTVGCSIISPPKFNDTEYRTVAEIATVVELGTCDKETITKLVTLSTFLEHYTKYLPNNEKTWESAVSLKEQVKELATKTTVSDTYCKLKMRLLQETADAIQYGAGGK